MFYRIVSCFCVFLFIYLFFAFIFETSFLCISAVAVLGLFLCRLGWPQNQSTWFCLPRARSKGVCHHCWAQSLYFEVSLVADFPCYCDWGRGGYNNYTEKWLFVFDTALELPLYGRLADPFAFTFMSWDYRHVLLSSA